MATPICRCRVLYLGSSVPHITKDGLHGIQEPLRELYPEEGVLGAKGIDSWLSVWSNGLLLENVDEKHKRVTRFFPIDSLHYCAAVRHVTIPGPDGDRVERFLPLDSPFARIPTPNNPPLFACILRRTSGIKVLECHAFVCKKEMAANALVRCCFHSYADNTYARHLETGSIYGSVAGGRAPREKLSPTSAKAPATNGTGTMIVNPIQKVEQWRAYVNNSTRDDSDNDGELVSIYDGDENHKVWAGGALGDDQHSIYTDYMSTIRSSKSANGTQRSNRPRQLSSPSSPPPPPPVKVNKSSDKKKDAAAKGPAKSRSALNGYSPMNSNSQRRFLASEFRPMYPPNMPPPPPPRGGMLMAPPIAYCAPPPPPHMLLSAPPPHHPGNVHRKPPKNMKKVPFPQPPLSHSSIPIMGPMRGSTEEPIYLPSARPISPVASYQPGAFPYEQYYLTQSGHPHKVVVHQQPAATSATKPTKYKKKAKSSGDNKVSDSESKFNTGIYKKKGHLNERAFSYSIRQEHRSRSHNSLATLNFGNGDSGTNPTNGDVTNGSLMLLNGTTNGHSTPVNGKGPQEHVLPHQNGHKSNNGHASPGPSHSNTGSSRNHVKKGASSATTATTTNGIKNMLNDLSLSDNDIEELGSARENSTISRRRLVAAATSSNNR